MIEGFLPSRYWLPLPFCTQRLLHILHVQHSLKHRINYPKGGKLVACKACWHVAFRAPVGDPIFLGTGVSWRQRPLCAAEMWTKSIAKWESTGGWSRLERGQNPKCHEIPECLAMCWLVKHWYGMRTGPVLNYPLHAFFLRKVQWLISEMGTSLPCGFCDDSTRGLLKGDFSISDRLFLVAGQSCSNQNFNSIPGEIIETESLGYEERSCVQRLLKQCWFDHRNLHLFDVGVQDPLVAPWGSPQY